MADAPSNSNPQDPAGGAGNGDPNNGGGNNTPPAGNPPADNNGGSDIDLSKLEGDQLTKVLENPNLFQLPRIKELLDASKELKTLK